MLRLFLNSGHFLLYYSRPVKAASQEDTMANSAQDTTEEILLSLKNDYLSAEEVMSLLGVSRQTIYNWTCGRKLPCYKFGKVLRFHIKDIQKFVESTRQEAIKV